MQTFSESALFYTNSCAMIFPSNHLVDSKSNCKLKTRVLIVIIA